MTKIIQKIKSLFQKYIDDLFIFLGFGLVIYATYRISLTAAIYVAGALSIVFGVFLGITGKKVN